MPDSPTFKEQQRLDWARAAAYWRRFDDGIRRTSAETTPRLLELADVRPGSRVLDIGSGTGEPGLPAAALVGPSGFVLLTDQSAEMLAVAREKAGAMGLRNVDFVASDAEELQLEPGSFDAALCRGALCLMPDPVACLRLVHEALRPGGRFAVLVVGRPEANPYFTTAAIVLARHGATPEFEPHAPGTFAFSDPARLRSTIAEAGFRDVHVEQLQYTHALGTGREYWQYVSGIAQIAALIDQVPADQHDAIGEEVAAAVTGGAPDGPVELAAEANLGSGVK